MCVKILVVRRSQNKEKPKKGLMNFSHILWESRHMHRWNRGCIYKEPGTETDIVCCCSVFSWWYLHFLSRFHITTSGVGT